MAGKRGRWPAGAILAILLAAGAAAAGLTPDQEARVIGLKLDCQKLKLEATSLRDRATADATRNSLTEVMNRIDEIHGRLEDILNNPR